MSTTSTEGPRATGPFEARRHPATSRREVAVPTPSTVARRAKPLGARPPLGKRHIPVVALGVEIEPHVVDRAADAGLTATDLALAVLEPEQRWPGHNNHSEVHLRGRVAVVVDDSGVVVAMSDREHALRMRTRPRDGAVRRINGGSGSGFPCDTADLLKMARAAGIEVVSTRDHYVLRHPSSTEQVVAARTPSDRHAIPNTVMEIKRRFGISLRKGTR